MKLVYYFLFVQSVCSISINNDDLEIEGSLRLREYLMNKLNLPRSMSKHVNKRGNGVLHNKLYYDARRKELEVTSEEVQTYFNQLILYGVIEITKLAKYLQKEFIVDENVTNILNNKIKDHKQKIQNYITINLKEQAKGNHRTIVEKEFMFLDILTFLNKVLQNDAKRMLDKVMESEYNWDKKVAVRKVNDLIDKIQNNHMKNIMKYICKKINICRFFPAFSDYITELITELLRLNDKKLLHFLQFVKTKIEERFNFFKSFVKQNVLNIITLQIEYMYQDDMYRNLLKTVRSTITERYTMPVTDDDEIMLRSTATSIFIDIINTTFGKDKDDLIEVTFNITTKAIQAWKKGERENIEMPVKILLDHIINTLRQNWNLATRKEVMILTEVMVLGQSFDDGFDELLTHGSEFVQNGIRPPLV